MKKLLQSKHEKNVTRTSSSAKLLLTTLLSLCLVSMESTANASERESLEQLRDTTVNLVKLLVQEGVLSKEKAELLLKQAQKDAEQAKAKDAIAQAVDEQTAPTNTALPTDKKMVRVQYVPEHVKEEIRKDVETVVMANLNYTAGERLAMPEWIDRLQWEGDIRLRYEHDAFGANNPTATNYNATNNVNTDDNGGFNANTTEDRDRFRIRARLALAAKINEHTKAGVRITTGSLRDPLSHNETGSMATGKLTIGLDRAFVKSNVTPWLTLQGGRIENPFFHTDLVWDPDLAFDGVAATFSPKLNDNFTTFATVGAFPVQDNQQSELNFASSKWLYGGQAGIKWNTPYKTTVKLGAALYEFDNYEGNRNPANPGTTAFDGSVPAFRRKGNTAFNINNPSNGNPDAFAIASKFREFNLTGEVDIGAFDPVHVVLTGDYVKNIGYDRSEITNRTGLVSTELGKEDTDAYQLRVTVGNHETTGTGGNLVIENRHDWRVYGAYKYLGADAVLDAFTDSNFFLGGTNAKGWVVEGNYGIDKNTWISARWLSAEEISPRGASATTLPLSPLSIDVFLLDLNTRF